MRLKDKSIKLLHKKLIEDFKVRATPNNSAAERLFINQTVHWGPQIITESGLTGRASKFKDGIVRVIKENSGLYHVEIIGYGGPNGLKLEAEVYRKGQQEIMESKILENQISILLFNNEIFEEVIDMEESSGLVTGYIVIRKKLTMTL